METTNLTNQTRLAKFIYSMLPLGVKFKPTKDFYKKTEINQKRLGLLLKDDTKLTLVEAQIIAKHFKADVQELINS